MHTSSQKPFTSPKTCGLLLCLLGALAGCNRAGEFSAGSSAITAIPEIAQATVTTRKNSGEEGLSPKARATKSSNEWQLGSSVLVLYAPHQSWYPAKIEKKIGNQYEIRYLDGSSEIVDADQLRADTLKEGDQVSGNYCGMGFYHAGKITWRDGEKLRIAYDGMGEEKTTMAAVRLPKEDQAPSNLTVLLDEYESESGYEYYVPAPTSTYEYQPTYTAPSYTPSYNSYPSVAPTYVPQSGYPGNVSQWDYARQQIDWTQKQNQR